jgi:prepilin-type N-terminal cleavage/methylation domain-containing protein
MQKNHNKGFSLIELIIVIAILGIIAAISIPQYFSVMESNKKKADTQTANSIARVINTAYADGTLQKLNIASGSQFTIPTADQNISQFLQTYMINPSGKTQSTNGSFTVKVLDEGECTVFINTTELYPIPNKNNGY